MQSFKETQQTFVALRAEHKQKESEIESKIDSVNTRINKLQKKTKKLEDARYDLPSPHWTEDLLRPLLNEVANSFPDLIWDFMEGKKDHLFVCGMRTNCSVFGQDKDGNTIVHLCFHPSGDLDKGELHYDTGKKIRELRDGELDLNGFNNIDKPVESVEEIVEYVNRQIKETEGCFFYLHMKLKPIRKFTKKEGRKDYNPPLESIGVSNYKKDSTNNYSYDEFYATAKAKNLDWADVFMLNDSIPVVPCTNELFKLKK